MQTCEVQKKIVKFHSDDSCRRVYLYKWYSQVGNRRVEYVCTQGPRPLASTEAADRARSGGVQREARGGARAANRLRRLPGSEAREALILDRAAPIPGLQKRMRVECKFRTYLNCRTYTVP